MKAVVAMDFFKESISSMQAGEAVRRGILSAFPDAEVIVLPLADGGEGTVDALTTGLGGELIQIPVTGPLGTPVEASYGVIPSLGLAVMEMMQASGLGLVPPEQRNPLNTTTYGVGELIRDALDRGYREFIMGLGGSATNDAGLGMLSALGYRFLRADGQSAGYYGRDVATVSAVDASQADPRLAECVFRLACDVTNPLCGPNGASVIYGPQKGATPALVEELDAALGSFAQVVKAATGKDVALLPGAGAAGGLGFGFSAFLTVELKRGVEVVLQAVGLEEAAVGADYVVTGEGRLDHQTAMGKTPVGVAAVAKRHGAVVIALSGSASHSAVACNDHGIDAYFPILNAPMTLSEAMAFDTASTNLEATARQAFLLARAVANRAGGR